MQAGAVTVNADGSFSGKGTLTFPSSSTTANFAGTVTPAGAGTGTLKIDIAFSDGSDCTSTGTWTAQDQS